MFKFMSKKGITFTLSTVLMMGALVGCGANTDTKTAASATPAASAAASASAKPSEAPKTTELSGTITASGSSALLPLVKQAADDFMKANPKVTINVTAGGSGTGIKNVADGTSDIGNSDVAPGDEYKDKGLKENFVAIAPFAFIVNKDVTIDNLTKQQAADIYMGKITNWNQVGGKEDKKIVLIHRPDSSGSRKLVQQIILEGKDFTKDGITQENSGAMKTAVVGQSSSIGYVDTPYIDDTVKALKIDGVAFSEDNIKNGTYKLFGIERMYTKGEAKEPAASFIKFIQAKSFQDKQVRDLKFLPADLLKK
ncbi:phosphate ABC transporter substrate-binding protein [Paenibacillus sp. SI8]|uniref:phosphate ABC transporter substrate-binding protein n=1 Tax=unclassified Paenibacillus TaxID=185978 RepID=UPI003465600D